MGHTGLNAGVARKVGELTLTKKTKLPLEPLKTITLGTFETVDKLERAISNISGEALCIMADDSFTMSQDEQEIRLVVCTAAQLGFTNGGYQTDVLDAAKQWGLKTCPREGAAYLRIAYPEQPKGDQLIILLDKPVLVATYIWAFYVYREYAEHGGKLWLGGCSRANQEPCWAPDSKFVFALS
jgi:hypothetical protein